MNGNTAKLGACSPLKIGLCLKHTRTDGTAAAAAAAFTLAAVYSHMLLQVAGSEEPFLADGTLVWQVTSMSLAVFFQVFELGEGFAADLAGVWLGASVYAFVHLQLMRAHERLQAGVTLVRTLSGVHSRVHAQRRRGRKLPCAVLAWEHAAGADVVVLAATVNSQTIRMLEGLFAEITLERAFLNVLLAMVKT